MALSVFSVTKTGDGAYNMPLLYHISSSRAICVGIMEVKIPFYQYFSRFMAVSFMGGRNHIAYCLLYRIHFTISGICTLKTK